MILPLLLISIFFLHSGDIFLVDSFRLGQISATKSKLNWILLNEYQYNGIAQVSSLRSISTRTDATESPSSQKNTATASTKTDFLVSLSEATQILQKFDDEVSKFAEEENIGMGGGVSASMYYTTLPEEELVQISHAVSVLVSHANQEREEDYTLGRVKLGICADDCMEALGTLKSWVSSLKLPRGLLHGMDVDGVPIDTSSFGPAFIKYNTGGAVTFSEIRRMGLGFDAIWKPGDAVLEGYDGDFRGVYINVELRDGEFRQYGVLPLNLFDL